MRQDDMRGVARLDTHSYKVVDGEDEATMSAIERVAGPGRITRLKGP